MPKIINTEDGSSSVLSEKFGVNYHSKHGAIQESRHVFIEAALHYRAETQKELSVLGIGFGTGLNALLTCLEAETLGLKIHYTTVEAFPLSLDFIKKLNYAEVLNLEQAASLFTKIHTCEWGTESTITPHFSILKQKKKFEDIQETAAFDAIYFDAFAPDVQPKLWEAPLMKSMYQSLKPDGVLTTYCAKGVVKRTLKSVGFRIEALPGPPGKREMTRAVKLLD